MTTKKTKPVKKVVKKKIVKKPVKKMTAADNMTAAEKRKEFDANVDNVVDRAVAFARKENAVERLRAIMNNIIENNGAFKP